jgi:LacI family transcriptional regulator
MENQKIHEKITIKHIAKVAGVSVSTVSRALRNDPAASPKTITRILNIAEKLNYYPDSLAKSLRQKKTNTIGIIFNDLNNPFYTEILSEIGEILNEKNYSMIICYSNYDFNREKKNILSLLSKRVDGVIISPISDKSENIELLSKNAIETVLIDCYPYFPEKNYVYTEHGKGAEIATEYLINNGHKDILLFSGSSDSLLAKQFISGYIQMLKKYKIKGHEDLIIRCDELSIESGYETFRSLLTSSQGTNRHFTGIITISDLLAVGIYKVANELGFNIPGNYSLIGYDNIEITSALSPPLTTIHQPRKRIGRESVRILLSRIESDNKEVNIIGFEPHIVVRGSVRKLN